MTIDSVQSSYSNYSSIGSTATTTDSDITQSFYDIMKAAEKKEADSKKTDRQKASEQIAEEADKFFKDMSKAGNALNYVVTSNIEKIKELIEKKKQELLTAGGYYSEPPLSPEAKMDLMNSVDKAIAEYTKQLMKELEDKSKAEKEAKNEQKTVSLKDLLS
ncbi:MAG: hypothetical protein PHE67_02055 [Campylobacterales bacterium]|nr:hypothetical protein [Campylobacterales bacterium]